MIRVSILAVVAAGALVSCVSTEPYRPVSKHEKVEFAYDRLEVYPDDVRTNTSTNYAGMPVAWVGVIRSTDAHDADDGVSISLDTVFEHHYFDWVQDNKMCGLKLSVSPRGEGLFRATWHLRKLSPETSFVEAKKYAKQGRLAIVYGSPLKIEDNGTVDLKYRYLRILDDDHFVTNEFDYGRLGEPFRPLHPNGKGAGKKVTKTASSTNSPPAKTN